MDKLDMQSVNITDENIEKIGNLFPNVIVESENGKTIDFDLLKQELSKEIVEGNKEKYQLTWPGKKEAILTANTPTKNTLRPVKEKSVDFDNTENIYIEGDNLEVLKILQESYLNKIKCIYIDPPYNTGNDFIYNDNFDKNKEQELLESGQIDEYNNRLISNSESNGKYHSNWLSMMYSRLKLARNLLSDDGVIFISIDDNEYSNLKKICDEIFGENNFISSMTNATGATQNGEGVKIQRNFEYILCYAKKYEENNINHIDKAEESLRSLADAPTPLHTRKDMGYTIYYNEKTNDIIAQLDYDKTKIELNEEHLVYENNIELIKLGYIPIRPGKKDNLLHRWRWGFDTFNERKNEIIIKKSNGKYGVFFKQSGINPPKNILNFPVGTLELKSLFDNEKVFDYPKCVNFIKRLLQIGSNSDSIILDFFSGSATTAQAVLELNKEEKSNRKYIMIQLPEKTNNKNYQTICDLGEERIRRAAKKIKEDTNANIDYGFRVYKVDSSNMKDVYYMPSDLSQEQLELFESNIKEDRTSEDLLTQVLLDLGLTLDLKIEKKEIMNNKVYFVDDNALIACFDNSIDINIVDEICKYNPLKVVFKDSSFKYDNDKINLEEKLKKLLPETEISIL